jgi:uncharacterized protein YjbI with pentapeptide repeats
LESNETKCEYSAEYFDYEIKNFQMFHCSLKPITGSKFCVFHSDKFSGTDAEFTDLLNKRISESINANEAVLLIGYRFPFDIYFKPASFDRIYLPNKEPNQHDPNIVVPMYFSKSIFNKRLEITNYHMKNVYFDNVVFYGIVMIAASLFERATFKETKFNNSSSFVMTRLVDANLEMISFQDVRFTGAIFYKLNLLGITFNGEANFPSAWFQGTTILNSVSFLKRCIFSESHFKSPTSFLFVNFLDGVDFRDSKFESRIYFINTLFRKQEETIFNSDLSKVSFKGTDITRIRFGVDATWNKDYKVIDELDLELSVDPIFSVINNYVYEKQTLRDFLILNGFIDPKDDYNFQVNQDKVNIILVGNSLTEKVIGEIDLSNSAFATLRLFDNEREYRFRRVVKNDREYYFYSQSNDIEDVLSIYRNLRENYEFQLRYDEAGKFFIREMELKRNYRRTK